MVAFVPVANIKHSFDIKYAHLGNERFFATFPLSSFAHQIGRKGCHRFNVKRMRMTRVLSI